MDTSSVFDDHEVSEMDMAQTREHPSESHSDTAPKPSITMKAKARASEWSLPFGVLVGMLSVLILLIVGLNTWIYVKSFVDPEFDTVPAYIINCDISDGDMTLGETLAQMLPLQETVPYDWHVIGPRRVQNTTTGAVEYTCPSPADAEQTVSGGESFLTVYVPEGFTATLQAMAMVASDASALPGVQIYLDQGRSFTTSLIMGTYTEATIAGIQSVVSAVMLQGMATSEDTLRSIQTAFTAIAGLASMGQVAQAKAVAATLASSLGGTVLPVSTSVAASATVSPLRTEVHNPLEGVPYGPAYFSTYVPLVVMYVAMMFLTNLVFITLRPQLDRRVQMSKATTALLRVGSLAVACGAYSLAVVLSLRMLGMDSMTQGDRSVGRAWMGLTLMGLAFGGMEACINTVVGFPGNMVLVFLLFFQLVSGDAILVVQVIPDWVSGIGQALPFYHAVNLLRKLFFGAATQSHAALHWAVLAAYALAGYGLAAFFMFWRDWRFMRPKTSFGLRCLLNAY